MAISAIADLTPAERAELLSSYKNNGSYYGPNYRCDQW